MVSFTSHNRRIIICRYPVYAQLLIFMTVYEESSRDEIAIGPFMETGFILFHLFISISHCEVYSKQRTRYVFSYDPLQRRLDAMSRRLRIGEYGQQWILYWIDLFIWDFLCLAVSYKSIASPDLNAFLRHYPMRVCTLCHTPDVKIHQG